MTIIRISASGGGAFNAHLTAPSGVSGHGVVVIHEIHGVNPGLRATLDAIAERGHVALAPDLFWRIAPDDTLQGHTAENGTQLLKQLDWTSAIADLDACVAHLRAMPECSDQVATVGYCMGGRLAFMMAMSGSADCDVSFHGVGLEQLVDGAPGIRHPVQVHLGTADHLVPPRAQEKIVSVLSRHRLAEVYTYAGAKHGFARPESKNFDPVAYDTGMERMFDFLDRLLGKVAG
jgi:carboxymethylenebutenolidase